MKTAVHTISLILAGLIILVAVLLHFYKLADVPYGYHVDEYSHAVTVRCMATEGVDAQNHRYPLFGDLNYGIPSPPTHMYPGMLWGHVFGYTVASMRLMNVVVYVIGLIGLFLLARLLFNWQYATVVLLIASISPWAWPLSRVGYGSFFAATFLIWALYFFLGKPKVYRWMISGAFFAATMYAYPPLRLEVPLMILPLFAFGHLRAQREGSNIAFNGLWKYAAAFFIPLMLLLGPLVAKTLSGEIQSRFNSISIFNAQYLASVGKTHSLFDLASVFWSNVFLHLTPDFLFKSGDPSFVHSTRHFGILGWLDSLGLILAVVFLMALPFRSTDNPWTKEWMFICFCLINIAWALIPVSLTNSELPNSLRICGAWPFMCLLSGFFIWQACERFWPMWLAIILTTVLFTYAFLNVYFIKYPQEAKGMFGFWTVEQAKNLKTNDDWMNFLIYYRHDDYHARYYLMNQRNVPCKESKKIWENLRDLMISKNIY